MFSVSNLLFGLLSLSTLAAAGATQRTFVGAPQSYDAGLFTPLDRLSGLSTSSFSTIGHPEFPRYNVRIKKSSFQCDESVNSYTGYIDIEAKHLFFYFFESRGNPDSDDVIFWTNGGPGCSSSMGLFMEVGPCKVASRNGTQVNPHSWNSNANIFFLDQPVGVGFSYADYSSEYVDTTEAAAKDVAAFVAIFFENFTKFKGRDFHIAGESYGGRYIPLFAAEIYDQNERLEKLGFTPINLVSMIIGNGIPDIYSMFMSYYDMACTAAAIPHLPPIMDIKTCIRMKQAVPRCKKWVKEACQDTFDPINCPAAAWGFCDSELFHPVFNSGINPYDISKECEGPIGETLCYPITKTISEYLSNHTLLRQLGVDSSVYERSNFTWSSCSPNTARAFIKKLDGLKPSLHHISALLERGVEALIYVGTYDWLCNHVGIEKWTKELEWSGQEDFGRAPLVDWILSEETEGKRAGMTRRARGLTYVTIEGAGHMAPYDKPLEAHEMLNRWLSSRKM